MRAAEYKLKAFSMTSTSRLVSAGLHTKGASVTRYTSSKGVFHQSCSTRIMYTYLHTEVAWPMSSCLYRRQRCPHAPSETVWRADDFHRAVGAGGHRSGHAPQEEALYTAQSLRPDYEAIGLPLGSDIGKDTFGVTFFDIRRHG